MVLQRSLLLIAFLGSFALLVGASEPSNAPTGVAEATDGAHTDAIQALLASMPHIPEIIQVGQRVLWRGDGASATIIGIDTASSDPLLETVLGPVRVARWVVEQHHCAVISALPNLIARAQAAHFVAAALVLQDGLLTGPSLHGTDVIVVDDGVMRQQTPPAEDRALEVAQLTRAIADLTADISHTVLNDLGRKSLLYVLAKLNGRDGGQTPDDFTPSFARRVTRHGWMRQWFGSPKDAAAVAALEQAVIAADQQRPIALLSGDGLKLEQMSNAFGQGGWVYSSPKAVMIAKTEAHPEFLNILPDLLVVVSLPPGSDPMHALDKAISAKIYQGTTLLAQWSIGSGFHADASAWPHMDGLHRGNLVPNALPPHILISGLDGDVTGLAVANGLLRPVKDATRAAAQLFITDAAALLPDDAHLDLIGEYLFTYVYPTPEAAHPELMGNPLIKGDVQQTVWQTCATALGGTMHGDCADIAELYQVITLAQGRNSIIIGLPEHAACAWADHRGQEWSVLVLQTGPPLAFTDRDLPQCLKKAYRNFDPAMAVDANELPLLLRFSGEVSRSEWSLSWRIFQDAAYAKAMIDVQRDWHDETYHHGITTMQRLIAGGDEDTANFRELAGIYAFTGQYERAAYFCREAIARTTDPTSRLNMSIQLIGHLLNAGMKSKSEALATEVLEHQLPALKQILGRSYVPMAIQLADICLNEEGRPHLSAIAQSTVITILQQPLDDAIAQVSGWLADNPTNQEVWDNSTELRSLRSQIEQTCSIIISLVAQCGPDRLANDRDLTRMAEAVHLWLNAIAFHGSDDPGSLLGRYAIAGRWYDALYGNATFDRQLDSVQPETELATLHADRGAPQQILRDMPWIRACVPYWYSMLARLFSHDRDHLDAKLVAHYAQRLAEARTATASLGLSTPQSEMQATLGEEVAALVAHDEPSLHGVLIRIAHANDKQMRDDAAMWIGDAARFLDPSWYATVLTAWKEDVDYQPKYFWIAWRAALSGAPRQALMAATLAVERFPTATAFSEELEYMRTLLAPVPAGASTTPAVDAPAPLQRPHVIIPGPIPQHASDGYSALPIDSPDERTTDAYLEWRADHQKSTTGNDGIPAVFHQYWSSPIAEDDCCVTA